MNSPTNMMSKFSQIQLLCFWISENTKFKITNMFDGKKGTITIKIYENKDEVRSTNIHSIENMWLKSESIVLKEMDKIIQHLLIIKQDF